VPLHGFENVETAAASTQLSTEKPTAKLLASKPKAISLAACLHLF
jgi:hypothetical protein